MNAVVLRLLALVLVLGLSAPPSLAAPAGADMSKPFSHASHFEVDRGKRKLACQDCHAMPKTRGTADAPVICGDEFRMPFPNHDACIPCHATAFFRPPLTICDNCHLSRTVDEKPEMKLQNQPGAPLKTAFSHRLHQSDEERVRKRFKLQKDCGFCHVMDKADAMPKMPSHAQCCECHTKEHVEPAIEQCSTCHFRDPKVTARPSRVRKFSHSSHRVDPETSQSLACERCHSAVAETGEIKEIRKPKMDTCVTCHVGKIAFSFSDCLKCHGPEVKNKIPPLGHPR